MTTDTDGKTTDTTPHGLPPPLTATMAALSQWPGSNSRPLSRHQLLESDLHLYGKRSTSRPSTATALAPSRQRAQQPMPHRDWRVTLKIDHLPQDHNNVAVRLPGPVSTSTPRRRHSASPWMRRGTRRPGLPVYQSVTSVPCRPLVPKKDIGPARCTECNRSDALGRESGGTPAARLHNR
jgi:hypothetical protein